MTTTQTFSPQVPGRSWRELIWPKEHGSWSLAFEPVALGLLCAPSVGGLFLGLAVTAGFFARRPLRIAVHEERIERRRAAGAAVATCAVLALGALAGAIAAGGFDWLVWLIP